jgi:acyl-CoA synthetase (AMP-forming)/AMP-acid ligase II/thioesterase domain-containing protein/acyl carrier protein
MTHAYSAIQVINTPQHLCIHQLLEHHAKRTPHAPAIAAPGRSPLTYGRLWGHIEKVTRALHARGLGPNDRIGLVLPNGPEMAVAFLATAAAASCAPLNPAYSADEFDFYLSDLCAKALILQAGIDSPARSIAQARGISIIELLPEFEAEAGLFALGAETKMRTTHRRLAQPNDVALVLHTAGTTSRPKLVPLTHGNICTSAHNIRVALELVESDRCLNMMPLFHGHGLTAAMLSSLVAGASIVCTAGFSTAQFFEWLAEFRPTWYTAVSAIHQAILERATLHHETIARCPLRFLRAGSASIPPKVVTELERVFHAPMVVAYGMTESSSQITCTPLPPRERKPGSVGVAMGTEVSIMDEAGILLPAGATGEIVIRGASVFQGYENNPMANESAFMHGWFRTGDQGHLDTDGYLFITGRLKEIINRGGEKVSPSEVEEVLREHPAVAEVTAFAMPHAHLGEDVAAAIVLRENASTTGMEIRAFAGARLAAFKVPRQIVFVGEIPKSAIGKVSRIGLAARLGHPAPGRTQPKVRAGFTGPRTPIEAELAGIWSKVLGLERVDIHDDFFELGGHSLQAVNLFAQIERVFGKNLPPPTLFQASTLEQLANLLSQEDQSTLWSSLVAVQSGGSKSPFFCVHAHGGHILVFKDLAYYLGADQPFYGLQAQGLNGKDAPHSCIEDMAADYIQEVRTVQPEGPYFLGGYCFGGMVAFEMAQQLHAQGQKVALLVLLDAYAPGYPQLLPWVLRVTQRVAYHLWRWARRVKQRVAYHLGNLGQLGPTAKLNYVLEKARNIKTRFETGIKVVNKSDLGIEDPVLHALRDVQEANMQASTHYVPRVYPARITLFRPSKQPIEYHHNSQMGWAELAGGGLEIYEISGHHHSIIVEPHVRLLAKQLSACLHKAQTIEPARVG